MRSLLRTKKVWYNSSEGNKRVRDTPKKGFVGVPRYFDLVFLHILSQLTQRYVNFILESSYLIYIISFFFLSGFSSVRLEEQLLFGQLIVYLF